MDFKFFCPVNHIVMGTEEFGCGHTHDNNKAALLGLLGTCLVCAIIVAGLSTYSLITQILTGTLWSAITFGLWTVSVYFKIAASSVGLAGASMQRPRLLMAFFVCDIVVVGIQFLLSVVDYIFFFLQTEQAGIFFFVVTLTYDLDWVVVSVLTVAMTLAFQARQNLVACGTDAPSPCGHTVDNNDNVLKGLLITALVGTVYFLVGEWFVNSLDRVLVSFVPGIVSLAAIICGIIAVFSPDLSARTKSNLFLAFFVMQVLYHITNYVVAVAIQIIRDHNSMSYFTVIPVVFGAPLFYLLGPTLVMAWQSRMNLLSDVQYYPLAEDPMVN